MQALPARGAMVAIQASAEEVRATLARYADVAGIAAVNGPADTVISGDEAAVLAIAAEWTGRGRKTKRLPVSHAFHSPLMEPMAAEFRRIAERLDYAPPTVPIVSTVTGTIAEPHTMTGAEYWVGQALSPVLFEQAVRELHAANAGVYLELGTGTLASLTHDCLPDPGRRPLVRALLRDGACEPESLVAALAQARIQGAACDIAALFPGAHRVDLPTYPFQRERYWLATPADRGDPAGLGLDTATHPFLSAATELPDGGSLFTGRISLEAQP